VNLLVYKGVYKSLIRVLKISKVDIQYKPIINIENIVATVTLDQGLDLYAMERSVPNVEYDPDQFPGLIFRLESPKVTSLIFKSGKMVVTGAKSTEELIKAVKRIIKTLKKHGIDITGKPKIQIQNIVASANLHVNVNLDKAAFLLENNMYEPEQFPGLIFRMDDPKVVLLIFSSGKMVITGAKREEEVYRAVKKIFEKLVELNCVKAIEEEEAFEF
jgi:transcription initiation factor TFIID TATA-box-binding protein